MNKDKKQRLFEVMSRLDKTFKPKLNENWYGDSNSYAEYIDEIKHFVGLIDNGKFDEAKQLLNKFENEGKINGLKSYLKEYGEFEAENWVFDNLGDMSENIYKDDDKTSKPQFKGSPSGARTSMMYYIDRVKRLNANNYTIPRLRTQDLNNIIGEIIYIDDWIEDASKINRTKIRQKHHETSVDYIINNVKNVKYDPIDEDVEKLRNIVIETLKRVKNYGSVDVYEAIDRLEEYFGADDWYKITSGISIAENIYKDDDKTSKAFRDFAKASDPEGHKRRWEKERPGEQEPENQKPQQTNQFKKDLSEDDSYLDGISFTNKIKHLEFISDNNLMVYYDDGSDELFKPSNPNEKIRMGQNGFVMWFIGTKSGVKLTIDANLDAEMDIGLSEVNLNENTKEVLKGRIKGNIKYFLERSIYRKRFTAVSLAQQMAVEVAGYNPSKHAHLVYEVLDEMVEQNEIKVEVGQSGMVKGQKLYYI